MFQTKIVEKIKTNFIFNNLFFKRRCGKYYTARQATDDNMVGANGMIDKYDYKHTLKT
jgi:hypothetical protein